MKLDISKNEVRISCDGENEKSYVQTIIDRIIFVFNPEITTWIHGVKVVGSAKQVGTEEVTE